MFFGLTIGVPMKYALIGDNMQLLKLDLEEGEKVYSDAGKLISKNENVTMTPRIAGGIGKAIIRKATGASGMLTEFMAKDGDGTVTVGGVFPGKVKMIELEEGESYVAEQYAFLAAQESVNFTVQFVKLGAAFFGGAGFVLQKFEGPGAVFIHVIGDIIDHKVDKSTSLEVDPGHIAGFSGTLKYNIRFVDNIRTALFGGVGVFLADFQGEGTVTLHSVSRFKLSAEILEAGKGNAGET